MRRTTRRRRRRRKKTKRKTFTITSNTLLITKRENTNFKRSLRIRRKVFNNSFKSKSTTFSNSGNGNDVVVVVVVAVVVVIVIVIVIVVVGKISNRNSILMKRQPHLKKRHNHLLLFFLSTNKIFQNYTNPNKRDNRGKGGHDEKEGGKGVTGRRGGDERGG